MSVCIVCAGRGELAEAPVHKSSCLYIAALGAQLRKLEVSKNPKSPALNRSKDLYIV